jgi:ADP-ribosylglycohydrolase
MLDEKCVGAFVASAIGDALGWPNEFRANNTIKKAKPLSNFTEWQRRTGGNYWNHTEKILAGEYSDDTQMNLAVARSILSGKPWVAHLSMEELPYWLEYERGGGGALKRAANSWKKKVAPWRSEEFKSYFNAGGNGAAMRVLSHVIAGIRQDYSVVADEIVQNAILTHGHPRAIVGALCYAYALMYLLKKTDTLSFGELANAVITAKNEWGGFPIMLNREWLSLAGGGYSIEWDKTVKESVMMLKKVVTALERGALDSENVTLDELGCFNKSVNGAGDIAAIASIYLASKYANNPMLGIKSAANAFGADTDTIASMVGGLLGALIGLSWIPAEWKIVQDYDCLAKMAEFLVAKEGISEAKKYAAKSSDKNNDWEKSPIGKLKKISALALPSGRTGVITISKYETVLGQTIYVKKMSRNKSVETKQLDHQISLIPRYALRLESAQAGIVFENKEFAQLNIEQLYKFMDLVNSLGDNMSQIATELRISENTARVLFGMLTEN